VYFHACYSDCLRDRSNTPSAVLKDLSDPFDPSDTCKSSCNTIGTSQFCFNLFMRDCGSPFAEYIKLKLRNPNLEAASLVLISPFLKMFLDPDVDAPVVDLKFDYISYGTCGPTRLLLRFSSSPYFSLNLQEKDSK